MTPIENAMALAVPLVKKWEGFRSTPYICSAGVWTIGYGTTLLESGPVGRDTPPVDEPDARIWLENDLRSKAARVLAAARGRVGEPTRFAALLSFAYNLGVGALRSSTLLRAHNAGDFQKALGEFPKWKFAGGRATRGLLLRRLDEAALYRRE
jgi:lysozyme